MRVIFLFLFLITLVVSWRSQYLGDYLDVQFPEKNSILVSTASSFAKIENSVIKYRRNIQQTPLGIVKDSFYANFKDNLYSWNFINGTLNFEKKIADKSHVKSIFLVNCKCSFIALYESGEICRRDLEGEVIWCSKGVNSNSVIGKFNDVVYSVSLVEKSLLDISVFDFKSGENIGKYTLNVSKNYVIQDSFIVWSEKDTLFGNRIGSEKIFDQKISTVVTGIQSSAYIIKKGEGNVFSLHTGNNQDFCLVRFNDKSVFEQFGKYHEFYPKNTLIKTYSDSRIFGMITLSRDPNWTIDQPFFVFYDTTKELHFNRKALRGIPYENIKKAFINRNQNDILELVVVLDDLKTYYLTSTETVWVREESLAEVIDAKFVQLPKEKSVKNHFQPKPSKSLIENYLSRIKFNTNVLGDYINSLFKESEYLSSNTSFIFRDRFGKNQLIVLTTKVGNVFAISTIDGTIIWRKNMKNLKKVTLIRESSSFKDSFEPLIAVVYGKNIQVLNALNGHEVSNNGLGFVPEHIFKLPCTTGHNDYQTLALIKNTSVEFFPNSSQSSCFKLDKAMFFHDATIGSSSVSGYSLDISTKSVKKRWTLDLLNDIIVSVGLKNENGRVASRGRVLGDRKVWYKYLNPNMLVIATAAKNMLAFGNNRGGGISNMLLKIIVLDTITGGIIHHGSHDNVVTLDIDELPLDAPLHQRVPVHIAWNENFIAYDFLSFQSRQKRSRSYDVLTQLNVIELYESRFPDVKYSGEVISSFNYTATPFASFQSYIFHSGVKALSTTSTWNGITNKELLVMTSKDNVCAVPRNLLDTRRVDKNQMTPEMKEEMIVPYSAYIEENPNIVISGNEEVDVNVIISYPAFLESTTLVLGYGKDLFFTTRTPSNGFDSLGKDFSRSSLLLLIGGLFGGIFICRELSKRQKLSDEWK